ncbi:MAG: di-heme-cytochrome C peroxidase, partial [Geminicoccaceae bacterium]
MMQQQTNAFRKARIALITFAFLGSTAGIAQAAESYGATGEMVWLEQGWSPFDRDWYYFQTQGAEIMPYEFFINLEQPDSEQLFRDGVHMNELGFTPFPPSPSNPDGLPMGFTRDGYRDVLGLNCAACHNGQVNYGGKQIIVDGGVALLDFPEFNKRLAAALKATLDDSAKFERFARRLLKADYKPDDIAALRRDLEAAAAERIDYNERQYTDAVPAGHG